MKATDLVDRLAEHKTLGAATREELAWLASHGSLRQLDAGDVLTAKGARVESLFVVLSGRIDITVDRGAGPKKIMEWRGGPRRLSWSLQTPTTRLRYAAAEFGSTFAATQ